MGTHVWPGSFWGHARRYSAPVTMAESINRLPSSTGPAIAATTVKRWSDVDIHEDQGQTVYGQNIWGTSRCWI